MVRSESVLRSLERARGHIDLITDPDIPLHEKAFKSMTLNTLDPADDFRLDKNKRGTHYDKDPMRYGALSTRGIEAAKPRPLYKYKTDGEGFLVKQFVGEKGMHPRVLIPRQTNRPVFSLKTDDIEGTKSEPKDIINKPRGTNPLCPEYILPCKREEAPPVPRFMRNTLDTSDIAGTNCGSLCKHPRRSRSRSSSAKASLSTTPRATSADGCNSNNNPPSAIHHPFMDDSSAMMSSIWDNRSLVTHDIDGSRPYSGQKQRVRKQKTRDHLLNVEDINRKKVINHKERDLSLKCEDVDGAKPHSLISSKSFRTTNYIEDIVGARPKKRFVDDTTTTSNNTAQETAAPTSSTKKTTTAITALDDGETKQDVKMNSSGNSSGNSASNVSPKKWTEENSSEGKVKSSSTQNNKCSNNNNSSPSISENKKAGDSNTNTQPTTTTTDNDAQSSSSSSSSLFTKKNVRFGDNVVQKLDTTTTKSTTTASPKMTPRSLLSASDVNSLRRQTAQPFRCHRRPVSAMPTALLNNNKKKRNKFNTHIQCLSGDSSAMMSTNEDEEEKWRPSNDMDIVKRNAHDINIANGHYVFAPRENTTTNAATDDHTHMSTTTTNDSSRTSTARSSARSSANNNTSTHSRSVKYTTTAHTGSNARQFYRRPDSAFAVLQGNILAQNNTSGASSSSSSNSSRQKISLITSRRERQQLESDISTIRNLM